MTTTNNGCSQRCLPHLGRWTRDDRSLSIRWLPTVPKTRISNRLRYCSTTTSSRKSRWKKAISLQGCRKGCLILSRIVWILRRTWSQRGLTLKRWWTTRLIIKGHFRCRSRPKILRARESCLSRIGLTIWSWKKNPTYQVPATTIPSLPTRRLNQKHHRTASRTRIVKSHTNICLKWTRRQDPLHI